jgi:hypothetical protein
MFGEFFFNYRISHNFLVFDYDFHIANCNWWVFAADGREIVIIVPSFGVGKNQPDCHGKN